MAQYYSLEIKQVDNQNKLFFRMIDDSDNKEICFPIDLRYIEPEEVFEQIKNFSNGEFSMDEDFTKQVIINMLKENINV